MAWTTSGDAQGFHILTAREKEGYAWKTAATLSEPGFDADSWIGNVCLTASGRRAVVVYAPRTFTNNPQLMSRGGFTAVVDLSSGAVTKLAVKSSLSYYNPGCGTGESAVLTQSGGDELPGTRLIRLDSATGKLSEPLKIAGQVTSAVPMLDGSMAGASGAQVVRISATGKRTPLARTDGVPYRITPDGEGGLSFLDKNKGRAKVKRIAAEALAHPSAKPAQPTVLAQGVATEVGLSRSAGTVYITGSTSRPESARALPSVVRRLTDIPKDATVSTRGASVITGAVWGDGKGTMLLPGEADKARTVKLSMVVTASKSRTSFVVDPERHESAALSEGMAMSPGLTGRTGGKAAARSLAAGASSSTDPVEEERTCSVPRNDPRNQAMQPKPRQVEWAVDQAITGYLNTHVQRPANWKNLGMPAYMPQGLFLNPVLDGGDRAMAQVMLGVTAQESNMWQAGREAVPGVTANPLIGNYYGIDLYDGDSSNDWDVNFAEADCGYGITQVTDHMRRSGREDGHGGAAWDYQKQRAVALDYTANIAAGLQILVSKWNETRAAGLVANHGADGRPENWYFALWAYNSGFHPNQGDGSPWGLGWANNPANPEWDAARLPFMENAAGGEDASAAAHPQNWPYQEKVLGFAAHPPSFLESPGVMVPAFRPSSWNGTNEAVTVKGSALYNRAHVKAPEDAFCAPTSNDCFPERISDGASNDSGASGPCGREDFKCWWHEPVTWKTDCSSTCGFEFVRFNSTYPEEADGTAYPPVCTTTGLPSGALVVDDVPEGTPVVRPGCSNSSWHNAGTFSFDFSNNGTESVYPSKVDLHQLGAGFGGHFYYGHTRADDAKGKRLKIEGRWRLNDPLKGSAKVMVHLPDHGAQTKLATYLIDTAHGTQSRTISQPGKGNRWVSLGAFRFDGVPEVRLSTVTSDGTGDEDIAFDAIAFVPGNYSDMPEVNFPAPDPSAPPVQFTDVPQEIENVDRRLAPAEQCGPVDRVSGTTLCTESKIYDGDPPDRKNARAAGGLVPWCDSTSGVHITRYEACVWREVSVTLKKGQAVVGTALLVTRQQIKAYSETSGWNSEIFIDLLSMTDIPDLSISWDPVCLEAARCNTTKQTWSSPASWIGGDRHTADGFVTHQWQKGTSGADLLMQSWKLNFRTSATPDPADDRWYSAFLDVRCDDQVGRYSGCVFENYTPSFVVNSASYPAAAAFYWVIMQKLPGHPGSKEHGRPLHRLADESVQAGNRRRMCENVSAGFIPNGATPDASCDEYPFAASKESGGQVSGLTGLDCVQLYAVPKADGTWTLHDDPNYLSIPTWNEKCGRASIPHDQNTGVGGDLGRFTQEKRILDDDIYWVQTPGFEGCRVDEVCVVRP